jgi:hypothetical protein
MAGDVAYVIRAEGVNFAATLDDTQDLSTIRGAGLALLALGAAVRAGLEEAGSHDIELVFTGASQAAFRFRAAAGAGETVRLAVLRRLRREGPSGEPFPHLSFVVDVAEGDNEKVAEARNHGRQFQEWTVPLPHFTEGAPEFDYFDRMRPATQRVRLPPGKLPGDRIAADGEWLSPSTAARHAFGRKMRQGFYANEAASDAVAGLTFAESFEDIVYRAPDGLPLSLRSRMALVYADGNGFGAIRSAVRAERFSQELLKLRRGLLRQVLAWFRSGLGQEGRFAIGSEGALPQLRLETLLWGGDELMFVMPSWLAFAFVEGLFTATRDWSIDGHRLTHTAGVVICHYKTPIRQARALAKEIAEEIKEQSRTGNAVGIEIFKSLMPPEDDLDSHRARLYGARGDGADDLVLDLAFPGEQFRELRERIRALSRDGPDGLPRSQLYRVLRAAKRGSPGLVSRDASVLVREELLDYERRVRKAEAFTTSGLRLPQFPGTNPRSLAMELALLAGFWDYADPFAADPLPSFPLEPAP